MDRKYKIHNQSAWHFLTFTIEGWIDIFSREIYRKIILDSFEFCQKNKGLHIGAWVIMSNHIHVIWQTDEENLSDIIRDFKTFTSKKIIKTAFDVSETRKDWLHYMFKFYANRHNNNKFFKVWTNTNFPREINSYDYLKTTLDYIHNKPVRAGIVAKPEHYLYSSATDYAGEKGCIEIEFLL